MAAITGSGWECRFATRALGSPSPLYCVAANEKGAVPGPQSQVVLLTGGLGGARLAPALRDALGPDRLTVVANVGDDLTWHGLRVCPDLVSVTYSLAGLWDSERGWGLREETFRVRDALVDLDAPAWFNVGDRDLAYHLLRGDRVREGYSLTEATRELSRRLGIEEVEILPASDEPCETHMLLEDERLLHFQEWYVGERAKPELREVRLARGTASGAAVPRSHGFLSAGTHASTVLRQQQAVLSPRLKVYAWNVWATVRTYRADFSGGRTTGRPKGCVLPHRGVFNLTQNGKREDQTQRACKKLLEHSTQGKKEWPITTSTGEKDRIAGEDKQPSALVWKSRLRSSQAPLGYLVRQDASWPQARLCHPRRAFRQRPKSALPRWGNLPCWFTGIPNA